MNTHAFHFTAAYNIEDIIKYGILSTNKKNKLSVNHYNIANNDIQNRRSSMVIDQTNNLTVHDYIPFYFCKRSPMLLGVLHKKNIDEQFIIYFAINIMKVINEIEGTVFTESSANTIIMPKIYNNLTDLSLLNWSEINNQSYSSATETLRHQKMAELLIPHTVELKYIDYIVVWNEYVGDEIKKIFHNLGLNCPNIIYDLRHYFTGWPENSNMPIVIGPYFLLEAFKESINNTIKSTSNIGTYSDINSCLNAIEANFDIIPELRDINYLYANYSTHRETVGKHSRDVVENLNLFDEFNQLNGVHKDLVKFAAYLHDIGKGPASRWDNSVMQKPDPNHSYKSLKMLERILTEEISNLPHSHIRSIFLLVTYDDLIGDILGKGRDETQLFELIESELELQMLIALSKADIYSNNPYWLSSNLERLTVLKDKTLNLLRTT